ncbi:membrane protein [Photobacterium angustum]|uniref:Zn-dependent protease n=2 Tax=Photobacterium angustum TaxID=661 RepID=A0A855SIK3_PHOAN|nr:membrane protein [Photobacterium angustum]KJG38741.1 membrane protein [Photobacterium angustum]KJG50370.1 membrane protein [Photobacterium angustum]KJG54249.1 membrane protein [Photobacterium angustum]PSX10014.1 hypothetical protein C0W41_04240 [Photobacterium angustum]PSX16773.1 hypothetical protein C0W55_04495 [Photobacterium angustum]
MLQITLHLLGTEFVKKTRSYLLLLSLFWGIIGFFTFIDGLDGKVFDAFCYFVILESIATLVIAPNSHGIHRKVLLLKGLLFLFSITLAFIDVKGSNFILSLAFGLIYLSIGVFNIASAIVVRFVMWRRVIIWGSIQIGYSLFLILNYNYVISYVLGFIMMTSSIRSIIVLIKKNQSEDNNSTRTSQLSRKYNKSNNNFDAESRGSSKHLSIPLTVHIWTPEGSAENPYIPRPVINRYIAATDIKGIISTGHAAIELGSELYMSLYPKDEIDRSPKEFIRTLKATPENNVLGRYLPDYQSEISEWCESNIKINFTKYNVQALKQFWEKNYHNPIYNLTSNNCSSNTAYALEAALEGVLHNENSNIFTFFKFITKPEVWLAAQIRNRAIMMAWTPGLVMDYTRALHSIVQPTSKPWHKFSILEKITIRDFFASN